MSFETLRERRNCPLTYTVVVVVLNEIKNCVSRERVLFSKVHLGGGYRESQFKFQKYPKGIRRTRPEQNRTTTVEIGRSV